MFKNFKTIPIIAFSADYDVASQELALKSGSSVCMEKPFDGYNGLSGGDRSPN
ncbi:MAG: DNA-binding response OmpR family regulator [Rickettsiales bacterium]|jgi:DNA-binding response OmpR family regulator